MKKEGKLINIRAFAILSVVLGHSIIMYSKGWNVYDIETVKLLNYLKVFINVYEMPLFFSLSGYLFYYTCLKEKKFTQFFKDKFLRLIVPFACINALWITPFKILIGVPGHAGVNYFEMVFRNIILLRNVGQLWFLVTLFIIFMIYFLLNKFLKLTDKSKKGMIIDVLIILVNLVLLYKYNFFKSFIEATGVLRVFQYLFYFYIGFLICKYFQWGKDEDTHRKIWVPYLCLFTGGLLIYRLLNGGAILNILCKILCVILCYLIIPSKTCKITEFLDKYSMGLFLIHSPFIYLTAKVLEGVSFNPYLAVAINFFGFGFVSILITMLLRKLNLKFMLGEK